MVQRTLLNALSVVVLAVVVLSDIQPGYLDFDNLPETNFSCEGKVIGGYYADVETGCQMFHVCTIGQKGDISDIKFLCLNGTVFDQETRVCERIDEVDCDKSEDFFNLNLELYGNTVSFGSHDCNNEDCEEETDDDEESEEDSEYDDDTEAPTTLRTTSTTTQRPTTSTQTTQQLTSHTTQRTDTIAALLALHNAFNQGLNRRPPTINQVTTRYPSITSTTTRRPSVGGFTLRTRFGSLDSQQSRPDHGYAFRPRPTYQPTFTSSLRTPLKSNYHTFESGDAHFAHSFDPDKPYHFQYFSHKSSPSPFTVRLEPEVSVVTSTSTSTSIRIANTTVDDNHYEDYDGFDPFYHDVQKINRPKRSTSRNPRLLKTLPDLDLDNFFQNVPAQNDSSSDHVIKIDQSDVLASKNYSSESPEQKTVYLSDLLDSIMTEDVEKKQVVSLLKDSEPEMEKIKSKGVDTMLKKLENKLLEMELEGRGTGAAFEYEGETFEIREKRGSDGKNIVENVKKEVEHDDGKNDEIICKNPEFCISSLNDDVIKLEIEDRRKRSARTRIVRVRVHGVDQKIDLLKDDGVRQPTTQAPAKTTKKSIRRKISRPVHNIERQSKARVVTERTKNRESKKAAERKHLPTSTPNIKPVTEEIENDLTTIEYRRPPLVMISRIRSKSHVESTTPFTVSSSTRLQTRFDYSNNIGSTTKRTTQKPTYYKHVPVYEDEEYPEIVELEKNKRHKIRKRSPVLVEDGTIRSARLAQYDDEPDVINYESIPLQRTRSRTKIRPESNGNGGGRTQTHSRSRNSNQSHRSENSRSRVRSGSAELAAHSRSQNVPLNRAFQGYEADIAKTGQTDSSFLETTRSPSRKYEYSTERARSLGDFANVPTLRQDVEDRSHGSRTEDGFQRHLTEPMQFEKPEGASGAKGRHSFDTEIPLDGLNSFRQFPNHEVNHRTQTTAKVATRKPQQATRRKAMRNRNRTNSADTTSSRTLAPSRNLERSNVNDGSYSDFHRATNLRNPQTVPVLQEVAKDDVSTTALPPTTYAPGPGIEPDPNFSCRGKVKGGLYADVHSDCHGFFICSQAKRGIVATHFWCGVGTRFNQKIRTCQAASLVDCSISPRFYHLNDNTYIPSVDLEEKLRGNFESFKV